MLSMERSWLDSSKTAPLPFKARKTDSSKIPISVATETFFADRHTVTDRIGRIMRKRERTEDKAVCRKGLRVAKRALLRIAEIADRRFHGGPGLIVGINRNPMPPCQDSDAANVVKVFMRNQNCLNVIREEPDLCNRGFGSLAADAAVDQDTGILCLNDIIVLCRRCG